MSRGTLNDRELLVLRHLATASGSVSEYWQGTARVGT
jgi:hypothetical protein